MKKISRISGCSGDLPEYFLQSCCVGGNAVCGQYGGWDRHGANHFDEEKTEEQVWILKTGKKYHKKSSCSGMKDPEKVSLSTAKDRGFTNCKKCYG